MAFVKLDCGILNSTLWVERGPRDVFITALLMAEPHEVVEDMPQFEVRSLTKTGFVVPPGWYGFVQAAGPGIVRMAMAEQEPGMAALEKLGAPDLESRSSEFEGRRLVRVDGGYIVLNYMKYREKDATSADRSRRYREKKRREAAADSGGDVQSPSHRDAASDTRDSSRRVTIAEEEAEEEIQGARSLREASAKTLTSVEPTAIGLVGMALKRGGIDPLSFSLGDPRLVALVQAGATPGEFEALATEAVAKGVGKPFPWVLAVLPERRAKAATTVLAPLPPPKSDSWRESDSKVRAMAVQLGVPCYSDDTMNVFEDRVVAAWRRRGEPPLRESEAA